MLKKPYCHCHQVSKPNLQNIYITSNEGQCQKMQKCFFTNDNATIIAFSKNVSISIILFKLDLHFLLQSSLSEAI